MCLYSFENEKNLVMLNFINTTMIDLSRNRFINYDKWDNNISCNGNNDNNCSIFCIPSLLPLSDLLVESLK